MVLSAGVFAGLARGKLLNIECTKDPTCTSLMAVTSTRGVLVTGEDTCKHDYMIDAIERTLRRVSSAMFVSFGVSLGGAVGPIEDGTDVFAGR